MMLRVGVVRPDRLDPWPDRSGQAPGLSGRPDRPAGLRQPWSEVQVYPENVEFKDGKHMKGCQTNERLTMNPLSRMESNHYRV